MEYRTFPATGDSLSVLGFGAMGFAGWFGQIDDDAAVRALRTALDLGVNVIDTARDYGRSEEVVGKALRSLPGSRPFLASKIQPLGPKEKFGMPLAVETVFPRGWVTESCEMSLRTLGVDTVDLMQLHQYWPTWGREGYWMDELQQLKADGKARSIGVSVPDHRNDMVIALVESGLIDSVQVLVNIFESAAFDTLVPICERNKVAVIARGVLDEGGLTGFLTPDLQFPDGDYRRGYFDNTIPRRVYMAKVGALRKYIPDHATSLAALAIKFVVGHSGVTTAISSMHVEEYARINVAAVEEQLIPHDIMLKLATSHRFGCNLGNNHHWDVAAADVVRSM